MNENNIQNFVKKNLELSSHSVTNQDLNSKMSLEEIAQEFESIFVFQMLKTARSAKLANDIFGNKGQETYQSLLDQEYAKTLAKGHNFGIAEALVRQFDKHVNGKK
tara:strand:- start:3707 stop:4024 length:318 start_codon:yes stop_codon:yes gene_type:complete